jgi:hypothetical protein
MGAKAGRKGGKSYNIRTVGQSWWRKYLDKMRRGTARTAAIEEQWDDMDERECTCGQIIPNLDTCTCRCGYCCNEERGG